MHVRTWQNSTGYCGPDTVPRAFHIKTAWIRKRRREKKTKTKHSVLLRPSSLYSSTRVVRDILCSKYFCHTKSSDRQQSRVKEKEAIKPKGPPTYLRTQPHGAGGPVSPEPR